MISMNNVQNRINVLISLGILSLTLYTAGFKAPNLTLLVFVVFTSSSIILLIIYYEYTSDTNLNLKKAAASDVWASSLVVLTSLSFIYLLTQFLVIAYLNPKTPNLGDIEYIVPIIIPIILGVVLIWSILKSRAIRNFKIDIAPGDLETFEDYESMDNPLSIVLDNGTKENIKVTIEASFPKDVEAKLQSEEVGSKAAKKWEVFVKAKSVETEYLFFKHEPGRPENNKLILNISSSKFQYRKIIDIYKQK